MPTLACITYNFMDSLYKELLVLSECTSEKRVKLVDVLNKCIQRSTDTTYISMRVTPTVYDLLNLKELYSAYSSSVITDEKYTDLLAASIGLLRDSLDSSNILLSPIPNKRYVLSVPDDYVALNV